MADSYEKRNPQQNKPNSLSELGLFCYLIIYKEVLEILFIFTNCHTVFNMI